MAKLVSLKRTDKDHRKDMGCCAPCEAIAPDYPWGLTLNLERDELDKLGIKTIPRVGKIYEVRAVVMVTTASKSAVDGADKEDRITLQITDLALEPEKG